MNASNCNDTFYVQFPLRRKEFNLHIELRKVAGSIPDEVIEFFSIDLILPAALGPGVYSASNRNEYQELIK
jgi:hypothetical protein